MRRRTFITLVGGAAVAVPFAARAQQSGKIWRVGIFWPNSPAASAGRMASLRNGLRELGYEENRNIVFVQRGPEHSLSPDGLKALAAELAQENVDVILTAGTSPTRAVKAAAGAIPTVMTFVSDPIGSGFVASLARPGGNIAGLTNFGPELSVKWLELLKELSPNAATVGVLYDSAVRGVANGMQRSAAALALQLNLFEINKDEAVTVAFASLSSRHAEALITFLPPRSPELVQRIVGYADVNRLPSVYWWREYVDGGGLVHYGPSISEMYGRAAAFIDKILKGAKPAELPVEQPTRFDLVINLKAAKKLDITVPGTLIARADELVE